MRSQEELTTRFEERLSSDMFGFETYEYMAYMDYDQVGALVENGTLKRKPTEEVWGETEDQEKIKERMHDYMDFAWMKANDMRGISANRSIMHYIAWIWIAGDDGLSRQVERMYSSDYHHYGKPILETICLYYGWDWKQWDNGERTNG